MAERLIPGHEQAFLSWFYQHYCANPESVESAVIDEYCRTFAATGGIGGALSVYRGIFDWMMQTAPLTQKKVNVPVLGLGGDKSLGVHVAEMLQQVATDVRGSAVPNCGHFIAEEQPMYLVDQLRQFFASTRRAPV
jgi:pimeloyl-ACP methyl ester carboxylesterase